MKITYADVAHACVAVALLASGHIPGRVEAQGASCAKGDLLESRKPAVGPVPLACRD